MILAAHAVPLLEAVEGAAVGPVADFVVVDMPAWEGARLLEARVVETWFGGRRVFEAGG